MGAGVQQPETDTRALSETCQDSPREPSGKWGNCQTIECQYDSGNMSCGKDQEPTRVKATPMQSIMKLIKRATLSQLDSSNRVSHHPIHQLDTSETQSLSSKNWGEPHRASKQHGEQTETPNPRTRERTPKDFRLKVSEPRMQ
jgi:hypothetical protein